MWIDTSPKKMYRCQISLWKDAKHHLSLGNYKLKQQWDTIPYLLQMVNKKQTKNNKKLSIPISYKDAEQWELFFF